LECRASLGRTPQSCTASTTRAAIAATVPAVDGGGSAISATAMTAAHTISVVSSFAAARFVHGVWR
jgi:hypothetical protein